MLGYSKGRRKPWPGSGFRPGKPSRLTMYQTAKTSVSESAVFRGRNPDPRPRFTARFAARYADIVSAVIKCPDDEPEDGADDRAERAGEKDPQQRALRAVRPE